MEASEPAPIRVLHVITGLHTGGAEVMLAKLASGTEPGRFCHAVISILPRGPMATRLEEAGIPVTCLDLKRRLPSLRALLRLRRAVRRFRPDVVEGWLIHGNLSALAVARSAPVIWSVRQSLYDLRYESPITRGLIRLSARLSRRPVRIIYNSRCGASHHERVGYDASRTLVIPNGFDLTAFRPDKRARASVCQELGCEPNAPLVGLVARFHPMKDHETFLRAAARVMRMRPDARFLLVGRDVDPSNQFLSALCRQLDLDRNVHLLGERDDTARIHAACDVAALSSYTEGFPNALGEAMACATPCVATDVGDCKWILGDTGRVVPPRAPEAFGDAVLALLDLTSEDRAALGHRARARVERHFDLPSICRAYEDVYRDVLAC